MEEAEELRELQEALSNYESLVASAGWKRLMRIAAGQLSQREILLHKPIENLLEILKQEFEKGESAGIKLFTKLPEVQIEVLTQDIEELNRRVQEDERRIKPESDGDTDSDGAGFQPSAP